MNLSKITIDQGGADGAKSSPQKSRKNKSGVPPVTGGVAGHVVDGNIDAMDEEDEVKFDPKVALNQDQIGDGGE